MFVHGGISEDDEYLDDCHLLNFSPLKWNSCIINVDSICPSLARHSACLVLPSEQMFNPKLSIYKLPEVGIGRRAVSRVLELFYFFNNFAVFIIY